MEEGTRLTTLYEVTDGDYVCAIFPASEVPSELLGNIEHVEKIDIPESCIPIEDYPSTISMGDESIKISENYVKAMIEMIDLKAEIEKEMVYCTAGYVIAQQKL